MPVIKFLAAVFAAGTVATFTPYFLMVLSDHYREGRGVGGAGDGYLLIGLTTIGVPVAAAFVALLVAPLTAYARRRGFADVSFVATCAALLAGIPAFFYMLFAENGRFEWTEALIAGSIMAAAGAAGGGVYWSLTGSDHDGPQPDDESTYE
jgi:hypothetical protein